VKDLQFGGQSFASFSIRAHVIAAFWLRRLSERRQSLVTWHRNAASARLLVGTAW
jgi:hypothetical protein